MAETQLDKLKRRIPEESSESVLNDYLESASNIIQSVRYPYLDWSDTTTYPLETRYYDLQIRIAVVLYNKIGAEGQTAHSENGIIRTYGASDVPNTMLSEIIPKVKVLV